MGVWGLGFQGLEFSIWGRSRPVEPPDCRGAALFRILYLSTKGPSRVVHLGRSTCHAITAVLSPFEDCSMLVLVPICSFAEPFVDYEVRYLNMDHSKIMDLLYHTKGVICTRIFVVQCRLNLRRLLEHEFFCVASNPFFTTHFRG